MENTWSRRRPRSSGTIELEWWKEPPRKLPLMVMTSEMGVLRAKSRIPGNFNVNLLEKFSPPEIFFFLR